MAGGSARSYRAAVPRPHWEVRRFSSIDSTNRYLLDEARGGAPEGLVAVADHQRAGRGRLGRAWVAPPGSALLASVLLRPQLGLEKLHLVTAVVALAAGDACTALTSARPDIKWPNDLVAGDRKLAGVLAEADLEGPRVAAVVVGVGLNIAWPDRAPAELGEGAVALAELASGEVVERDALLDSMLSNLAWRYRDLHDEEGRQRQLFELRTRCVTLGQRVRVDLAGGALSGVAAGLSPEGHLLVDTGDTTKTVAAGDVVHLRSSS